MYGLEAIMSSAEAVMYLVNLAVAGSVVCGAGLLAARACRHGSAPLRHGVLVWTLTLILISPGAVWLAQRDGLALVRIAVSGLPSTYRTATADKRVAQSHLSSASARGAEGQGTAGLYEQGHGSVAQRTRPNPVPEEEETNAVSSSERSSIAVNGAASASERHSYRVWWQAIGSIAALAWAVGAALGLARLAWGCVALIRFCCGLDLLLEPGRKLLVHEAADALRLRKVPAVFLSHSAGVPLSIGLLRPAIVLPEVMLREADSQQLEAILLHEMAHIARRDHWVGVGQRIAAVLFWWNPLVHWACYEISELREEICDNHVVLVQGEGQRLARILVDLAARVTTGTLLPSTVGVLEPKLAGLTGRVTRLLDKERNMEIRMKLRSRVCVLGFTLTVLLGMATISALRLAYAEPATETKPAVADKNEEALSEGAQGQEDCWALWSGRL